VGNAAWIVFELSMLEHAFICYCLELYLLKTQAGARRLADGEGLLRHLLLAPAVDL
jgi:hypothetical protein